MLCCIPARYESTRLPGKPLLKINGKTIINLVYEQVLKTKIIDIIVLTDSELIYKEVLSFGGNCAIVSEYCLNGTERICNYLNKIDNSKYNIIVNVQGDEPFIEPNVIDKIIENFIEKKPICSTVCYKTDNADEIILKSRGKTIVDKNNNILYCSRNVIPTNKNTNIIPGFLYLIHVGIFVFDKNYLLGEYSKENTQYQLAEDIEWLKIIEQGYNVNTIFSEKLERGIDTKEDYEYLLKKYQKY
jgi:3-deoxy-manno-octulosonate cytidylyltransferase (CMP-KDO synthetase)